MAAAGQRGCTEPAVAGRQCPEAGCRDRVSNPGTISVPAYPSIRCAIPTWREIVRRIELVAPDALHIATEGPIGHIVRHYCLVRKIFFTTSYITRFPEY